MECGRMKDKVINIVKSILDLIKRHKKLFGVLFIVFVAVALIGGRKFWHYAESSEFCGSCHEMDVHYDSFMSSKHHNEHVHSCHTCHVGPGLKGFLHAKLSDGAHDSFEHMKKTYLTSANSGLFIDIAEDSIPIINGNCLNCHINEEYTKDKTHLECVSQSKRKIEDGNFKDFFCTDCHIGVVHPSWSADVYKAYAEKKIPPFGIFTEDDCYACHRHATPEVVKEWTKSPHAKQGVSCLECHGDDHGQIVERKGMVLPSKCGECHVTMYTDFAQSRHYTGRIVAEFDGLVSSTKNATMRKDCEECHMLGLNKSWDTGPGGSCEGCHPKHLFSRTKAAEAKVCEKCHIGGPPHAQLDMSVKSVHGKLYGRWEEEGKIKLRCQSCHSDPYSHHNFNRNVSLN
ncbi:MAG: NapC/NirT family cytochrome c [Candidatus Scalindua sediminis]|jgi:nitrate/TMAO reductase-like tetraheme cytochrome c subunit